MQGIGCRIKRARESEREVGWWRRKEEDGGGAGERETERLKARETERGREGEGESNGMATECEKRMCVCLCTNGWVCVCSKDFRICRSCETSLYLSTASLLYLARLVYFETSQGFAGILLDLPLLES